MGQQAPQTKRVVASGRTPAHPLGRQLEPAVVKPASSWRLESELRKHLGSREASGAYQRNWTVGEARGFFRVRDFRLATTARG